MPGSSSPIPASPAPRRDAEPDRPSSESSALLAVGDAVRLVAVPPYLKSADPMPMLRPSDLVEWQEIGRVVEIRALGQFAVRFRRGTFLMRGEDLSPAGSPG
jgi:hypothetical protein